MARERIPLLLYTLPRGFATLLRRDYDVDLDKEHGEVWHEYADPGTSLASPAPTHWVKRELAANMRQASKATGGLLPSTVRRD